MGDVLDLTAARARRRALELVLPGARVSWDPDRRIAVLTHVDGEELDTPDAVVISEALLAWAGPGQQPYGLVVVGAGDSMGTVAYRQEMARLRKLHAPQRFTTMWGGTAHSRFLAKTYNRGNGFANGTFELEEDAYAWLAARGIS